MRSRHALNRSASSLVTEEGLLPRVDEILCRLLVPHCDSHVGGELVAWLSPSHRSAMLERPSQGRARVTSSLHESRPASRLPQPWQQQAHPRCRSRPMKERARLAHHVTHRDHRSSAYRCTAMKGSTSSAPSPHSCATRRCSSRWS